MKVGFTGTRKGMSKHQYMATALLVRELAASELHHGDCCGADESAHEIAINYGLRIIVHPARGYENRAFCRGYSELRNAAPYLERDQHIVDETEVLIATPYSGEEKRELRSGTWATVRKARKKGVPIYIIVPDGTVRKENCDGEIV